MQEIRFKIKRQDSPSELSYWEEFFVPYQEDMTVITALNYIRKNPVTSEGIKTTPVIFESSCLDSICGACTMIINGKVAEACRIKVSHLDEPITLEPMLKFAVLRDLQVDRSELFEALKKAKAWVSIDDIINSDSQKRVDPEIDKKAEIFTKCIFCGSCLESCPQYNARSLYMGAFVVGQVHLFNMHALGKFEEKQRTEIMMQKGGIADCANVGNCIKICPREIPLNEAIAKMGWDTTLHAIRKFFR